MVVTGDIAELFYLAAGEHSVQVQQKQARFEWASAMLFNCEHCKTLTPEFIDDEANVLFDMKWGTVGHFPAEWNHCVSYAEPRTDAKLYHYTAGIPVWPETRGLPEDFAWVQEAKMLTHTVGWKDLMGTSVHAKSTIQRFVDRMKL